MDKKYSSLKLAKLAMRKTPYKFKVALLFYFIGSFIGKLIFFTRPIFKVADANLAKQAMNRGTISLSKCFEGAFDGKRYSSLIVYYLTVFLTIALTALLIMFPSVLGGIIASEVGDDTFRTVQGLAVDISSFAAAIFFIYFVVSAAPAGYVAREGKNLDMSDIMYNTNHSLRFGTKLKLFLKDIFETLVLALVYGIILFASYYLMSMASSLSSYLYYIIAFVVFFGGMLLSAFFAPRIMLAFNISRYRKIAEWTPTAKVRFLMEKENPENPESNN